jgi:hypothetical protein
MTQCFRHYRVICRWKLPVCEFIVLCWYSVLLNNLKLKAFKREYLQIYYNIFCFSFLKLYRLIFNIFYICNYFLLKFSRWWEVFWRSENCSLTQFLATLAIFSNRLCCLLSNNYQKCMTYFNKISFPIFFNYTQHLFTSMTLSLTCQPTFPTN